jgi:hypothetical protein
VIAGGQVRQGGGIGIGVWITIRGEEEEGRRGMEWENRNHTTQHNTTQHNRTSRGDAVGLISSSAAYSPSMRSV